MRSPLLILFLTVGLVACGARQSGTGSRLADQAPDRAQVHAIQSAIKAQNFRRALELLKELKASEGSRSREWARLFQSRLQARDDIGRAADSMLLVHHTSTHEDVATEAGFYAGLFAVQARRCLTARKLLPGYMGNDVPLLRRAEASLSLSGCETGQAALKLLSVALTAPAVHERAEDAVRQVLKGFDAKGLGTLLERQANTPLATVVAKEILGRSQRKIPSLLRAQARQALGGPADKQKSMASRPTERVTLIMPLTDHSAGKFAQRLKQDFEYREARLVEDRIGRSNVDLIDGSDANAIDAAFATIAERGEGATIGLFDRTTLPHAIEAAQRHQIPTLLLTASGRGRRSDAPTWRILPTSSHAVLSVGGAFRDRRAHKILVIRDESKTSKRRAQQLATVWERHCQTVTSDCRLNVLSGTPEDAERLALEASQTDFDALYLPVNAVYGAQLLKYLATHGIWAGTPALKTSTSGTARRVTVVGSTRWYRSGALGLLGTYGHGALLPVPFAIETERGERIAHLLQDGIDPNRRTVLVIALDAIDAIRAARREARKTGAALIDVMRKQGYVAGATVGFDFTRKHALRTLMLLEITAQGFRPHQAD